MLVNRGYPCVELTKNLITDENNVLEILFGGRCRQIYYVAKPH